MRFSLGAFFVLRQIKCFRTLSALVNVNDEAASYQGCPESLTLFCQSAPSPAVAFREKWVSKIYEDVRLAYVRIYQATSPLERLVQYTLKLQSILEFPKVSSRISSHLFRKSPHFRDESISSRHVTSHCYLCRFQVSIRVGF